MQRNKQNLTELFELLKLKGFVYIKCTIYDDNYSLECSTLHNGKGNIIVIVLFEDDNNILQIYLNYDEINNDNINFREIINTLNTLPNYDK